MWRLGRLVELCTLWQYCKLTRQICTNLDQGEGLSPEVVTKLCIATDLALYVIKQEEVRLLLLIL